MIIKGPYEKGDFYTDDFSPVYDDCVGFYNVRSGRMAVRFSRQARSGSKIVADGDVNPWIPIIIFVAASNLRKIENGIGNICQKVLRRLGE